MNLVEVKRLNKRFDNGIALEDISFYINEKGVFGFTGRLEAGKSELAAVLAGCAEPDEGNVFYKETDIYENEKSCVLAKMKIGYMPEKSFFYSDMTVFETLNFTGKAKGVEPDKRFRQIKEALALVGLSEQKTTLVGNLNRSQKRFLGVANAVIGNPDVIILDEPMAALDATYKDNMTSVISMLGKMKPVLLFCRNPIDAQELCAQAVIMHKGRILMNDSVEDCLERINSSSAQGSTYSLGDVMNALIAQAESEAE